MVNDPSDGPGCPGGDIQDGESGGCGSCHREAPASEGFVETLQLISLIGAGCDPNFGSGKDIPGR